MSLEVFTLFLALYLGTCTGFRCHVCSYSSNTDHTTDCILNPQRLTAPENYYACNRSCFIQENYSLETKAIASYMRSCVDSTKRGCVQDTWSIVCYFTCKGELCNDYPYPLHKVYPPDSGEPNGKTGSSPRVTAPLALVVVLVWTTFVLWS